MRRAATVLLGFLICGSAWAGEASWGDSNRWQKWEHSKRWSADDATHRNAERRSAKWAAYQDRLAANLALRDGERGVRRGQTVTDSGGNDGICDVLADATPGLENLCVAFCEAQDCRPDFTLDNPFAGCSAGSADVLAAYDEQRGVNDPAMPCLVDAEPDPLPVPDPQPEPDPDVIECACWSADELAALRVPSGSDTLGFCFQNASSEPTFANYDTWHLSSVDYETTLSTIEMSEADGNGSVCSIVDECTDGSCLGIRRYMPVTPSQFAACEASLAASAAARDLTCQNLGG